MKEKDFKQLYGNNKVRLGGTDSSSSSDLSIKVDIDVSDALTGLKAIQREARKATATLKELEVQQKKNRSLPTGSLKLHKFTFDEMHNKCPECNGTDFGTIQLKADNEIIDTKNNTCLKCWWSR